MLKKPWISLSFWMFTKIIGFGRIGLEVARRGLAFGLNILAYDVIPIKTDLAIRQVSLDELLTQADIITLHVPKTPQPVLGEKEFQKMKILLE